MTYACCTRKRLGSVFLKRFLKIFLCLQVPLVPVFNLILNLLLDHLKGNHLQEETVSLSLSA